MIKKIKEVLQTLQIILAIADLIEDLKKNFANEYEDLKSTVGGFLDSLDEYAETTEATWDNKAAKKLRELLKM